MHTIFVRGNTMVAVDIRSLTVDAPLDLKEPATQKEILDLLAKGGGNQLKLNDAGTTALFGILATPGLQE